jgi:hypothetical protein
MTNQVASKQTTNIVPVQGVFGPEPTFTLQYFVGPAGTPFFPPISPFQSGLIITNSTIDSSVIGGNVPAAATFTNVNTTTGSITTLPTANTDIANKQYVDSVAQGLNIKAACAYSTTASITLSGLGTQAGGDWPSTLTAGDRILVKNQGSAQFNGIYIASASTWARSSDMNAWAEVPSAFTFVQQGTTLADTGWVCTSDPGGTIDVTPITWTQFSGAGSYLAGNGLQLSGNTFSVLANGTTINVSSSGIKISDNYAGQSTITTVGTLTTGTWNANTIAAAYGGTGLSSYTTGDLIVASGSTTLTQLSDVATGNVLLSGGAGVAPSYGKVGLTTHVSGILPIANGGTNSNATATAGAVAYGTGTAYAFNSAGLAGQYLQSTGSGAPAWTTIANSGIGSPGYFGSFFDLGANQTAANTTTAYVMRINTTVESNGISLASNGTYLSRMTVANGGVYSFIPSIQFVNSDSQIHDVQVWFRKNGTDIPDSNSQWSVPNKHGGVDGNLIAALAFTVTLNAGDYVEMVWAVTNTSVFISTYPAGTTPTTPAVPGVIVSVTSQAQIGIGYYGLTSTSTVTPGLGTKTFVTNQPSTSVAFTVGTAVRIAYQSDPTEFMQGVITSFSGTSMNVLVDAFNGSSARSAWDISVSGSSGVTTFSAGTTGLTPNSATYGNVTLGGTLVAANGGTGQSSYTVGDLLYATGSTALSKLGIGASTTILTSSGSAPQWSAASGVTVGTATNLAGGAAASIPYQSGAGTTAFLASAAGDAGKVLQSNGTSAPTWVTPTAYATVTDDTTTNATRYPLFANQTSGNLTTLFSSSTKYQYNPSTGILTATGFAGNATGLTGLPAGELTGTIPSTVLGNSSLHVGTTTIALNRASASQSLTGVSIDGSAGSATNATNAVNIGITDDTSTNADYFPVWVTNSTGNLPARVTSTKLKFNPSSGAMTVTGGIGGGAF